MDFLRNVFIPTSKQFSKNETSLLWQLVGHPLQSPHTLGGKFWNFLLQYYLKLVHQFGPPTIDCVLYLPTGAYVLLKHIRKFFPEHGIIFSDFNKLSETMPGINAPLVQRTTGTVTIEWPSYLNAMSRTYDVFFPTNFRNLNIIFQTLNSDRKVSSQIYPTREFMKCHAEVSATRTRLGYNPLLSDYKNTSIFFSDIPE